VGRLDAHVEEHHPQDEPGQVPPQEREDAERHERDQERDAGREARSAPVGEATHPGNGEGPGEPDEAEEPRPFGAPVVRRRLEEEGERRPEDAEGSEHHGADEGRPPELGLVADERPEGGEELHVAHGPLWGRRRQEAGEPDGEQDHAGGGERVDGPPAECASDEPGHRAGEQDAGQDAAHDEADDPPALAGVGEVRGERQRHVGHDGEEPHRQAGDGEPGGPRRGGGSEEGDAGGQHEPQGQPPALHGIPEGNEDEKPQRVPHLSQDRDPANRAGRHPEGPRHLREKRLGVIQIRHRGGRCDGQKKDELGRNPLRCRWVSFFLGRLGGHV